jgi:hypothetical protein
LLVASECGMRPLAAHCQTGLGQLCRRAGRLDDARGYLGRAVDLYAQMKMSFWLRPARLELRKLKDL